MKCSAENMILRGIFHVVSYFDYTFHVTVQYIAEIPISFQTVYCSKKKIKSSTLFPQTCYELLVHIEYSHDYR